MGAATALTEKIARIYRGVIGDYPGIHVTDAMNIATERVKAALTKDELDLVQAIGLYEILEEDARLRGNVTPIRKEAD